MQRQRREPKEKEELKPKLNNVFYIERKRN